MKKRKTPSNDNLILSKSLSDTTKSQPDLLKNKKKLSPRNNFFKKSAEFLQTYKSILNTPLTHGPGNPDRYFKQSLRHYDDYDLVNLQNWGRRRIKRERSVESLTLQNKLKAAALSAQGDSRRRHRRTAAEATPRDKHQEKKEEKREEKKEEKKEELVLKEIYRVREGSFIAETLTEEREDEESEDEIEPEEFYSPTSQPTGDPEETLEEKETGFHSYLSDIQPIEAPAAEEAPAAQAPEASQVPEAPIPPEDTEKFKSVTEVEDTNSEKEYEMADEEVDDMVDQAGSELNAMMNSLTVGAEGEESGLETGGEETEMPEDDEAFDEPSEAMPSEAMASEVDDVSVSGTTTTSKKTPVGFGNAITDSMLQELEEAERQAMDTAKIIYELKQRVAELLGKPKMTETEARELEVKNRELKEQMALFEAKTKRIQFLVDQANIFDNMSPRPVTHDEDILPKVIVCGITENNMPKIIVCEDKKRKPVLPKGHLTLPPPVDVMPQFAKRLSESYYMQEKLVAANADLEGKRYQLQEDLLDKDQTVESLQRKLTSLQGEMRMVCKENCLLTEKLQKVEACPATCNKEVCDQLQPPTCKKHPQGPPQQQRKASTMACGKGRAPCPADVENRLQEYSETTQQLERQLTEMEREVQNMQSELVAVQKERQHLEQHRRMLAQPPCMPPPPCPPPPCGPSPPCGAPCPPPPCMKPPCPAPCNPRAGGDQQLRELREQYNRLQDDFKSKVTEVAGLRADIEKAKQAVKDSEEAKKLAEEKVKEYEKMAKGFKLEQNKMMGSKEQLIEQEQQLNVAKQRFREAQDELEELRALIQDQQAQLDDYRNKYLQAQQQVEEQRRQIDMMEMENNRISEQVNLEIQRVKNQFQEKLQELTPLPDILKATQLKLQEAQQLHLLAERNNEALVNELQAYRDKAAAMAQQMEQVRSDQELGADAHQRLMNRAEENEQKLSELEDENNGLKSELAQAQDLADQNETKVQEKLHEIAQLVSQLETVREESARQVARTKDRCETVRRSMQNQITDLERQLAQSRAQARSAQKDRDEIRQKMQAQINNLNENFEDAQMRIRNLQGHVNFLKSSYTSVFPPADPLLTDPCDCGNNY